MAKKNGEIFNTSQIGETQSIQSIFALEFIPVGLLDVVCSGDNVETSPSGYCLAQGIDECLTICQQMSVQDLMDLVITEGRSQQSCVDESFRQRTEIALIIARNAQHAFLQNRPGLIR